MSEIQLHNIPLQPTPFIGRELEISEIVGLLRDKSCRLLTLLGAGGMGKTRLSIESVKQLTQDDFEHGVYYVPLAPLASADNIVTTVIGVLGIMIGDDGTPQQELVKFLKGRNLLLVMDNFEHVLEGADLVADILGNTQNVKILTTSREPLNLRMERLWHVRGMRIPDKTKIDDIDLYSGLKLFIDRATWVRHDFNVDAQMESIIQICKLVGGMPLGIELSASWLKTLSCKQIIKQIERGIDFLSTRARDIPERHRSIRAVFDYSWDLLTASEQAVFPRLSVFRGGFTLEAAEEVADADLMTLSGLVEKSMVRRDETGRYDLHELLRQYADEKLNDAGEVEETLSAHMNYFADFMVERTIDVKGRRQLDGLNEIEVEFNNIVEVWFQTIDTVDYAVLDKIMEGLLLYTDMRSLRDQGLRLFQVAVDKLLHNLSEPIPSVLNRLRIYWLNTWHVYESDREQLFPSSLKELLYTSLENTYEYEGEEDQAWCRLGLGWYAILSDQIDEYPIEQFRLAASLFEKNDNQYGLSRALRNEAWFKGENVGKLFRGSLITFDQFAEVNQNYIDITRGMGDYSGMAHGLKNAADVGERTGHLEESYERYKEAYQIWVDYGDRRSLKIVCHALAFYQLYAGDFEKAKQFIKQFVDIGELINQVHPGIRLSIISFITCIEGDFLDGHKLANQAIQLSPWSFDNTAEKALVIAEIGLGNDDRAGERLLTALHYHAETFRLLDVIHWIAIATYLVAYKGDDDFAIELYGLVMSQPEFITGWLLKWDLWTNLKMDIQKKMDTDQFESSLEKGSTRDILTTMRELLDYFGVDSSTQPTPVAQPLPEPLTDRELEVLALMADGLTNPQIAEKLYLSTGTIKVHTRNIYGKLNVSNRTEAAKKARELGLI